MTKKLPSGYTIRPETGSIYQWYTRVYFEDRPIGYACSNSAKSLVRKARRVARKHAFLQSRTNL